MSTSRIVPQSARPGSSRWPGLSRKKVTLAVASTATPRTAPGRAVDAGRNVHREHPPSAAPVGVDPPTSVRASPSRSRASPAPNSASITQAAPSRSIAPAGATPPAKRAAARAASPASVSRRPRRPSSTGKPRPASSRAATNPSPPLLPGPHRTTIRPRDRASRAASSATARPAASIRTGPGVPPAIVRRSASPISAGVSSSGCFEGSSMGRRWPAAAPGASAKNGLARRQNLLYGRPADPR